MQTGWVSTGGAWYYMKASGAMHTGWLKPGSAWYYLGAGSMVTGTYVIDGATHRFNSPSSARITPATNRIGASKYDPREQGRGEDHVSDLLPATLRRTLAAAPSSFQTSDSPAKK
ncbi:MAG: hypothetical protein U0P48_08000 [Ancrocorticia sp.]